MLWPTLLAVAATIYAVVRIVLTLRARDARGAQPVALQFAPPAELSPGTAARLLRDTNDDVGARAEIIDLAVNGVWQLGVHDVDGTATGFVRRPQPYEPILRPVPQAVYRASFTRGDMTLSRDLLPDGPRHEALLAATAEARRMALSQGWIRPSRNTRLVLDLIGQGLIAAAVIIPASAAMKAGGTLVNPNGPAGLPLIIYGGAVGFVSQFLGIKPWTLTPEGRRLVDHLDGLRRFMTLPDAERRATASLSTSALERLLPYAVLFDIVPDWIEVLRADHERGGTFPTWVNQGQDAAATASVFGSLERVGGLRRLGA